MSAKVVCFVFLALFLKIAFAAEAHGQDDFVTPILINTQNELHAVKAITKEVLALQKKELRQQEANLAKTSDILAQGKLQASSFDNAYNTLRIEQSNAERHILLANCFLALFVFLLAFSRRPYIKPISPINPLQPSKEDDNPPAASADLAPTIKSTITSKSIAPENAAPNTADGINSTGNKAPTISSIEITKAAPFFDESSATNQFHLQLPDPNSTSWSVTEILAQAEQLKKLSLEKIRGPKQNMSHLPPANLDIYRPRSRPCK